MSLALLAFVLVLASPLVRAQSGTPAFGMELSGPVNFVAYSGVPASPLTVTLTNTGTAPVTGLTAGISTNADLWSITNNCPASLEPGQSCTLLVRLSPPAGTTAVSLSTALTVLSTNAGTKDPVALSGQVLYAEVTAAPASLSFNALAGTTSPPQTLTFTATNGVASQITVRSSQATFVITQDGCTGLSLAPGQSCAVGVAYAPPASPGGASHGAGLVLQVAANLQASQNRVDIGNANLSGSSSGALALSVSKSGTGSGTVTSAPAGIDCGASCAAIFAADSVVTLTAAPGGSSSFAGWSGACTNTTGPCSVTMSTARSVAANFIATTSPLSVGISFTPGTIRAGGSAQLAVTVINPNATPTGTDFTVDLPSGLVNASTQYSATSFDAGPCPIDSSVTLVTGGSTIVWHSGSIGASGKSCTYYSDVKSDSAGNFTVSLPSNAITNVFGSSAAASATLTVLPPLRSVTPSVGTNGLVSPGTQSVTQGDTATFVLTPDAGYFATVSGTCGGTLSGNTFTTLPVTADCTVVASFTPGVKYVVTTTAESGQGSWTNALIDLNNNQCAAANKRIEFAIPAATDPGCNAATGVCVVQLEFFNGRNISCPNVVVDGYTQPGASPNSATDRTNNAQLKIEFAGTNALAINHDYVTVRGIAFASVAVNLITRQQFGVGLVPTYSTILGGNYFGWRADGRTPVGGANGARITLNNGQSVNIGGARVGGPNAADRNLITYVALGDGVTISGSSGAVIEGNVINLDRDGNVVSGASTNQGIASDVGGNEQNIVRRNTIANTRESGISCSAGAGLTVTENEIYNVNLSMQAHPRGIAMAPECNRGQAAPVITSVVEGAAVAVQGTLNSVAGEAFRIEFFHNATADTANLGRGEQFVSYIQATTNAAGFAGFTANLPAFVRNVSATATRVSTGDTSVFSSTYTTALPVLTVSKAGSGAGNVSSAPAAIDCGAVCSGAFPVGAVVVLSATPTAGSTFTGWSGACSNTSGTCTVTMDAAKTVTANFAVAVLPLSVSISFSPATVPAGGSAQMIVTVVNPNSTNTGTQFTLNLPGGLVNKFAFGSASEVLAGSACGTNTNVNAVVGGSTFGWSSATLGTAGQGCIYISEVIAANAGSFTVSLPANAITNAFGNQSAAASATLTVTPAATNPVAFFPDTVDFGERVPGFTASQGSISFANNSTVPLTISAITVSPGFAVSGCPVGTVIAANSGCFLTASATPASAGYVEGKVQITTNPPSTNALLTLAVRGVAAADGTLVQNTNSTGTGSLNRALTFVRNNCAAGPHTVRFNIAGAGSKIIAVGEVPLPPIDCDGTIIDGYSQPGTAMNTATDGTTNAVLRIGIDGSDQQNRLEIRANQVTVRGLSITGSAGGDGGIYVDGSNNVIAGNFIGVGPGGTGGGGNGIGVMLYNGTGNRIGGALPEDRNLITGNTNNGIRLACCNGATRTEIRNNLVGGDNAGEATISNGAAGIELDVPGATVADNVIRFNGGYGIYVKAGDNQLSQNALAGNATRGICNLAVTPVTFEQTCAPVQDDVTAPYDQDGGAGLTDSGNHLQNHPSLNSLIHAEGNSKVGGVLRTDGAGVTYRIEMFANTTAGTAQAEQFVHAFTVTTDASGEAPFLAIFGELRDHITATATRLTAPYDTSELSQPVSRVVANPVLTVEKTGNANDFVVSSPAGILCEPSCSAAFNTGTNVILTAEPGPGRIFVGWGGACSGTGPCTVTMDAAKTVTALFDSALRTLTVEKTGMGSDFVVSNPAGLSCEPTCFADFATGSTVTLTAEPGPARIFVGWGGACSGIGPCSVTMDAAKTVTALFDSPVRTLTVNKTGASTDFVVSTPTGLNCGSTCSAGFTTGSTVTLVAEPGPGRTFVSWGGACSGSGVCNVVLDVAKTVSATFMATTATLTIRRAGGGTGTITSSPAGIVCGSECTGTFPVGTQVTLTAEVGADSAFTGWAGACSSTTTCVVTLNSPSEVTATIVSTLKLLTVQSTGGGAGLVVSTPAGINCSGTCTASFPQGTMVTLNHSANSGSVFAGWSGACIGNGACVVTMDAAKAVLVSFVPAPPVLTVQNLGSGTGLVVSNPAGINCGATCSATFTLGATVTLLVDPSGGSTFGGWGGACSGTGACTVSMNAAKTVTATFNPPAVAAAFAYITNQNSGNVSVIDTLSNTVVGTIFTGTNPNGIAVNAAGTRAYVGNGSSNTVSAIDTFTGNVLANIPVGSPFGIALNPAGTRAYVANTITGAMVVINTATNTVVTSIADAALRGLVVNPAGTRVYAANFNNVKVIDTTSNTIVATVPLTAAAPNTPTPQGMAVHPAGTEVYVANQTNNTVEVISTASNTVIATIAVGASPVGVGFNPAGTRAYVTNSNSNDVSVIDAATRGVIATIPVGTRPQGVSVTPDGLRAYVANRNSHNVSVIDTASNTVVATVDAGTNPTAYGHFTGPVPVQFNLTVTKAGTGDGLVVSSPAGISCGTTCSAGFAGGIQVTLTADPAGLNAFTGWSGGGCTGTGVCTVSMDAAKNVTATFESTARTLTVQKTGNGIGFVASFPAGISCGATCSAEFGVGSTVTLSVDPAELTAFTGWSGGGCSGTGLCTVSMDIAKTVTANFESTARTLTVQKTGAGTGLVVSFPTGISCDPTCSAEFAVGSTVTLSTDAFGSSAFAGWSGGGCSGTGLCTVTMDVAKTVSANFVSTLQTLTVQVVGGGTAFVASSPAGILCGSTCSAGFESGSTVTLNADPSGASIFAGWSGGGCGGTGSCVVTMNAAKTVTANVVLPPVAVISAPATGQVGIALTLNASASTASGTVVQYRWSSLVRPAGSVVPALPLNSASSLLTFSPDKLGHYEFQLVVVDDLGLQSAPAVVAFNVIDISNPTAVLAASPLQVNAGSAVTLSGASSFDTGGGRIVQYAFSAISRPAGATVFAAPVVSATPSISFTPDKGGVWQLGLVVTDDAGNSSTQATLALPVVALPVAVVSAPANGSVGVELLLNAGASTSPGTVVQYTWSLVQRPAGSVVPANLPLQSADALFRFTPDKSGQYKLQLVVGDNNGNQSAPLVVTILVLDAGSPTAVLAATPTQVNAGSPVTLSGASSFDSGGGRIISYTFSAITRPAGAAAFASPVVSATPSISFTPDKGGVWQLGLVVTDDAGNESAIATISLSVVALPVAVVSAPTNGSIGVELLLNAGASTSPGQVVQYNWTLVERPAGSAVLANLPLQSADALFRFTPDKLGRYKLQLVVGDNNGNQSAPLVVTILVVDAANPTALLDAFPAAPVVGGLVALSGSRSADTGGGRIISYTFNAISRPAGAAAFATAVVSDTPSITFTPDKAGLWRISLVVGDDSGNVSAPTELVLNVALPPFELDSVASRKTHGSAGDFDLPIKPGIPVTGFVSVEPRISQAGHRIVFTFNAPVSAFGAVTSTDHTGAPIGAASAAKNGNELVVTLTFVPDASRVRVRVAGVNGGLDAEVAVGFLLGDVSGSRLVDSADVSAVRSRSGQKAASGNFRFDITASGVTNSTDVLVTKLRQGARLP